MAASLIIAGIVVVIGYLALTSLQIFDDENPDAPRTLMEAICRDFSDIHTVKIIMIMASLTFMVVFMMSYAVVLAGNWL